jgi:hypothetical protein
MLCHARNSDTFAPAAAALCSGLSKYRPRKRRGLQFFLR